MGKSTGLLTASSGLLMATSALLLLLSLTAMRPAAGASFNITTLLSTVPSLASYNRLLTSTGVADEINARSSITVLAYPDAVLTPFLASFPNAGSSDVGDLFRYSTLLQYFDIPELQKSITPGNPLTVTTLYQTTGRAQGNDGSVNLYNDGRSLQVGRADVNATPNATIITNVTQILYNISVLQVDFVVSPPGFGAPANNSANLTSILQQGKNFNTLIGLLQSTGVDAIFAAKQTGSGITVFAPTDAAFNALPAGALAAATADQKKLIIEYHALNMYYTLGSLNTLNNPATPTLATTDAGTGTYLLSVLTGPNGVNISTGVSTATIAATLYDTPPTVVYSIATILLPQEIFALAPTPAPALVPVPAPAPSNATVPAPAPSPLAPSPLTPAPAPSPLPPASTPTPTPTPTPSSAPVPSPTSPSPVPTAVSPGPPAPPTPTTAGTGTPESSPEEAPAGDESHAPMKSSAGLVSLAVVALASSMLSFSGL